MKRNQSNSVFKINRAKTLLLCLFAITVLRLVIASFLPVVGDETYYWIWGQNLRLSYFDHPPAVAWLTWLSNSSTKWLPFLSPALGLRWPFIIVSSLTFWVWAWCFYEENQIQDEKHNVLLVSFSVLYFLNPLLGVGGIFATPDIPLLFFWSLSYLSVLKILKNQKPTWYALLGLFLGLGFCSKYHIVLFPACVITGLFFTRRLAALKSEKLWITFLFGLVFSLPVILWNYQNEWSSFAFQLKHGLNAKIFHFSWPMTYILGQILIFNPVLLWALLKQVRNSLSRTVAISQWAFFIYSSFKALVEANWPMTSHAQGLTALGSKNQKYFKPAVVYWGIIWIGLASASRFTEYGRLKTNRLPQSIAAQEIIDQTKEYRPLFGPTYQLSSLLTFVSGENIYKFCNMSRHDFYDRLQGCEPTTPEFYLLKYSYTDWPEALLNSKTKFEEIRRFEKFDLTLFRVSHE